MSRQVPSRNGGDCRAWLAAPQGTGCLLRNKPERMLAALTTRRITHAISFAPGCMATPLLDRCGRAVSAARICGRFLAASAHHTVRPSGRVLLFQGQPTLRAMAAGASPVRPDGSRMAGSQGDSIAGQADRHRHDGCEFNGLLVVPSSPLGVVPRRLLPGRGRVVVALAHGSACGEMSRDGFPRGPARCRYRALRATS